VTREITDFTGVLSTGGRLERASAFLITVLDFFATFPYRNGMSREQTRPNSLSAGRAKAGDEVAYRSGRNKPRDSMVRHHGTRL
jgi:hypothetical protein